MNAKYILAVLAVIFVIAALRRFGRDSRHFDGQSRTWLLIALIFAVVSAYLFYSQ